MSIELVWWNPVEHSPSWNLGCAKQGGTIRADGTSPRSRRQEDVKQSSRGQKRHGEDVEELLATAEEKHLDADVEVPTWKIMEDRRRCQGCGRRKKIAESLRPLGNDDEM